MNRQCQSLACAIGMLFVSSASMAETIKCTGSTTITGVVFTQDVLKEIKDKLGIEVEAVGSSSGAGFKDLMEGKVPCSMSTASFASLLTKNNLGEGAGFKAWPLGSDTVVPVVHRNNAVKTKVLTKEQWAGIYSGKTKNWSEVGGPDLPVVVIISADEGSATRQEVQKDIMGGAPYPADARKATTTKDEVAAVGATLGGVGAVGKGLAAGNPAVAIMGEPLLKRDMILITKEPPAGFEKLVNHLRTPEVKAKTGIE
ncbi:MAG: substrate-binding domain-containing protein [Alphaproteobacteria bacterium]